MTQEDCKERIDRQPYDDVFWKGVNRAIFGGLRKQQKPFGSNATESLERMSFAPEQHAARSVRTAGRTLLTSISQSTREQSCPNRNQSRESPLPLKQTGNYDLMVRSETDRASSRGLPGQVPTPPQRRLGARSLRDDRDSVRDGVSGFRGVRSRGSERTEQIGRAHV